MILFNAQNNMPQQLTYYIIITTQYPPYSIVHSSFLFFMRPIERSNIAVVFAQQLYLSEGSRSNLLDHSMWQITQIHEIN